MFALTCAHRSLPLGSWIRVTNLRNHKSIFVRVNDRGPVPENRVVDLSYAAARAVGIRGLGKVKLEPVRDGNPELAKELMAQLNIPLIPVSGQ
jgi:rare lipoprotein A